MSQSLSLSRTPALLLAACGLMLFLTACRGDPGEGGDPDLSLEVGISPTPPAVGPARLIITLSDAGGLPVEGARIEVEGNMSHAGMTPVLDTAVAEAPGRYAVSDFRFTMAGDWILTLRATLPDGRQREIRHRTNVVRAPPGGETP